jgi:hypothetical protein
LLNTTYQQWRSIWQMREMKMHALVHLCHKGRCYLDPSQICHLHWWLTNTFLNHMDIFHVYTDVRINKLTEMQPWFQNSWRCTLFEATFPVGRTGSNLPHFNHAEQTQMFWVIIELWQGVAWVLWLR